MTGLITGAPVSTRRPPRAVHALGRHALLLILVILTLMFTVTTPYFGTIGNFVDIWRNASIAGIMFVGLTFVVASGEIDVAFMNIAALTGVLFAWMLGHRWDPMGAAAMSLLAGAAFGVVNGLLVGLLRFPALIVTIATGGLAAALAFIVGDGQPIYVTRNTVFTAFINANLFGMPAIGLLGLGLFALAFLVEDRFLIGHHIYALAQNRKALEEIGIACRRIIFGLFVFSGLTASVAGILLAAVLKSGQPTIGNSFFLDGLTVVLLGTAAFRIGKPNIVGTVIALALLSVLVNALALLGWPNSAVQIVKGALLLLGVSITLLPRRTAGRALSR